MALSTSLTDLEKNKFVETADGETAVRTTATLSVGSVAIDTIYSGTPTDTNTSIASATSTTIKAANTSRKYLEVQNNSTTNVLVSLDGATLTSATPSASNPGVLLRPGESWTNTATYCPTAAVTAYQSSGSAVDSVTVVEGA